MCSTPFGITGCYALAGYPNENPFFACSTPFGITGCYARGKRRPRNVPFVLNAFRHHRVLRGRHLGPLEPGRWCSTPFGITGCYATSRWSNSGTRRCAQRLSASQGATLRVRVYARGQNPWCSTPFGITGCYAHHQGPVRLPYHVLNAFRHHRVLRIRSNASSNAMSSCSTPFGITGCYAVSGVPLTSRVSGAQRLSASQGATRFDGRRSSSPGECSTPFGITGCYAREINVSGQTFTVCSTPFGITGCYASRVISKSLTFECAQRLSASQGATPDGDLYPTSPLWCSTPFGITGCYATGRCRDDSALHVLNAFRHHRVLRTDLIETVVHRYSLCSTPFGITGCYAVGS